MNHSHVMLSLYRYALRRALTVDADVETLHRVRTLFRKRRNVTNALLLQQFVKEVLEWKSVKPVKKVKKEPLPSPPSPSRPHPSPPLRLPKGINSLTADELSEFHSTTTVPVEPLNNARVHHRWLCSINDWTPKTRLHPSYAANILPTLVRHAKAVRSLNTLKTKLNRPQGSTHKLRRINGTSAWLYVVNTPWNTSLRTSSSDLAQIFTLRKQYDTLICEEQLLRAHRTRYGDHHGEYFTEYEKHLQSQLRHVHAASIAFARAQGLLHAKTSRLFARDTQRCRNSLLSLTAALAREPSALAGEHLDILGGGLSATAAHYGFHI